MQKNQKMRRYALKYSVLLIMLIFVSQTLSAQSYTKERKISRSFLVSDQTEVEIINKYGDITVVPWEEDSVKVVIAYKVISSKESKLDKTFSAINFDFKANPHYVVIKTNIEGKGTFWSDVSEITETLFSGGTHTSIDFTVYTPANQYLNIELKYGDLYLPTHKGNLKLNISNGNIKAHSLEGKTEISLVFGDAVINSITNADIKADYSNINIENIDFANFSSRSSEFELTEVKNVVIDSKRDKYRIESLGKASGDLYFTRFMIDELLEELSLKTKYGSLRLKEIDEEVDNIDLETINTSVNIILSDERDYSITITSDEKSDISYSAGIGDFKTMEVPDKEKTLRAECIYGNEKQAVPLNVNVTSGTLSLKLENY